MVTWEVLEMVAGLVVVEVLVVADRSVVLLDSYVYLVVC
jgi:hypothetical protein